MIIKQENPFIHSRSFILFSLFLISVFIALGTWQLQRKTEKEALLLSLATMWEGEVCNVDEVQTPLLMKPLIAEGHYVPGKTVFLQSKTYQGKSGVYVLDVFHTQQGKYLLVQRGWSSKEHMAIPSSTIKLEGIVRVPSPPTYFQPTNKPPTYFWIDMKSLSKELQLPLLPYYLVAKTSDDPQILPTDPFPLPPNNHLEYAITWYGLAFSLLVMLFWNLKNCFYKEYR